MIDLIAKLLWNPFLCFFYISVGALFLYFTNALAWRKSFKIFAGIFRNDKSKYNDNVISHTKAFLSTIAATTGVGNLAGVGTAIHLGGPGALFWMWVSALIGMSFRLASTYFAVKFRPKDTKSLAFATPMTYLQKACTGSWRFVTPLIAGLIFIQGIVLSNLVQANSLAHALHKQFNIPKVAIAIVLTIFVAFVILGGLKRIVDYSSAVAPWMILFYVLAGVFILISDPLRTLNALKEVFTFAFNPVSMVGGFTGYTVLQAMQFGISRGVFSHGSGLGTSAFLQGANEEPPAIGAFMAAMTPFVDTMIICTITGLVIISAPFWPHYTGAFLTLASFDLGLKTLGEIVVISSLIIFAFTTITAFAYISEKCFRYLGGTNILTYRIIFLGVTFIGPFLDLNFVWSLSDIIIGMIIIFHLIPLLNLTLANLPEMLKDLNDAKL